MYVWSVFLIDGFSFTVSWFCGKEGDNNDKDEKERDLKEKVEKGKEKKEDNMK